VYLMPHGDHYRLRDAAGHRPIGSERR
jgi:hypothetical protein